MAKIVPQGYADIQQYSETDDYLKLLEYLSNIGETYSESRDELVAETKSAMAYLNSAIDNATSVDELTSASDLYNNTYSRLGGISSPEIDILDSTFNNNLSKRAKSFQDFDKIASMWASNITSSNNVFGTSFIDLDAKGMVDAWHMGEKKDTQKRLEMAHQDAGEKYTDVNNDYKISYADADEATKIKMADEFFTAWSPGTRSN
jgi:hypothetical protein